MTDQRPCAAPSLLVPGKSGMTLRGAALARGCAAASPVCAHLLCGAGRRGPAEAPRLETLRASVPVWREDMIDPPAGLLVSGILRYERHDAEGRRQILNLLLPGDVVLPARLARAGCTLATATPATLCRVPGATLARLGRENAEVRNAIYRSSATQLERMRWLTWAILALRPAERICAFLDFATGVLPCQPLPDGTCILSVTLARRDIADLLSTSVETLCRMLKALEHEGLIRLRTPSHIQLLDRAELAARSRGAGSDAW